MSDLTFFGSKWLFSIDLTGLLRVQEKSRVLSIQTRNYSLPFLIEISPVPFTNCYVIGIACQQCCRINQSDSVPFSKDRCVYCYVELVANSFEIGALGHRSTNLWDILQRRGRISGRSQNRVKGIIINCNAQLKHKQPIKKSDYLETSVRSVAALNETIRRRDCDDTCYIIFVHVHSNNVIRANRMNRSFGKHAEHMKNKEIVNRISGLEGFFPEFQMDTTSVSFDIFIWKYNSEKKDFVRLCISRNITQLTSISAVAIGYIAAKYNSAECITLNVKFFIDWM